jgi:hypothetical protein
MLYLYLQQMNIKTNLAWKIINNAFGKYVYVCPEAAYATHEFRVFSQLHPVSRVRYLR